MEFISTLHVLLYQPSCYQRGTSEALFKQGTIGIGSILLEPWIVSLNLNHIVIVLSGSEGRLAFASELGDFIYTTIAPVYRRGTSSRSADKMI